MRKRGQQGATKSLVLLKIVESEPLWARLEPEAPSDYRLGESFPGGESIQVAETHSHDLTGLIQAHAAGDPGALQRLLPLVHAELRSLAARALRRERKDHTMQPTDLVSEVYLKLADQAEVDWGDRTHFFSVAAGAVRQVLVDHARRHDAQKRGGGRKPFTLHDFDAILPAHSLDLLSLDDALHVLAELDPEQHRVVEMRFFGGMRVEEIARVMSMSPRTVKNRWRAARAWLIAHLQTEEEEQA